MYNTYRVLPEYVIEYQRGGLPSTSHLTRIRTVTNNNTLFQLEKLKDKLTKPRSPSKKQMKSLSATLYALERAVPSYTVPSSASTMTLLQRTEALIAFVSKLTGTPSTVPSRSNWHAQLLATVIGKN